VKAVRSARANAPAVQQASEAHSLLLTPRLASLHFSATEVRHLALGTALVTAAGISFTLGNSFTILGLILAALIFSMGFILHELAHKYVAQGYGLWAEFRVNATGVILTALSIVSPIKFIAPGAVMISGFAEKERIGRTAISGPIVNVIITVGLVALLPVLRGSLVYGPVLFGAGINAFLALFNLIPFSVFDGRKVFYWNKHYWAALFVVSLALTIYTGFVLRPFG
jgi:Zn-dependent protease